MEKIRVGRIVVSVALLTLGVFVAAAADAPWMRRDLNPVKTVPVAGAVPLKLADNGIGMAVLVIPPASEDVRILNVHCCPNGPVVWPKNGTNAAFFAAQEIAKYVEKASGAKLPIVFSGEPLPEGLVPVYVGRSAASEAVGFVADGLTGESFRITNNGRAVGIIGAPKGSHGSLDALGATVFAAYDFLERFVGVRFYYHGEQGVSIERRKTIVVPGITYEDRPWYDNRYAYSFRWRDQPDNCAQVTALRFRVGGNGWGAERVYQHIPANLAKGLPPDCYQVGEDGKPTPTIPQMPCFGNPKTLDGLMAAYDNWFTNKDPELKKAVWDRGTGVSDYALGFGPPDHEVNCHCAYCAKYPCRTDRVYWEQQSEVMGTFAQQLSWRIRKAYPGRRFYYLPYYNYASAPERGEFADNAWFRLCFMYGLSTHSDPFVRQKHIEWADGWIRAGHGKKISGYLYRWPSPRGGATVPFQYYRACKLFFTDMRDRATGFFDGIPANPNVQAFTSYCMMRLEWNPDFDVEAAVPEMYRRLFGPASADMAAIYDGFTKTFESHRASDFKKGLFGGPYEAPTFSDDEVFSMLATEQLMAMASNRLASARQKVAAAEKIYRDRVEYFAGPIELLAKLRAFHEKGGKADEKTLCAAAVQTGAVTVDGRLDESAWGQVAPVGLVPTRMAIGCDTPDEPTEVRVLAAPDGLYVGMRMREPRMNERSLSAPDNLVYRNDGIEIAFDALNAGNRPDANFSQYYVSSDGRMLYGNNATFRNQNEASVVCAWGYEKDFWTFELFAPFAEILRKIPADKRADVKRIKANFHRRHRCAGVNFSSSWRTNYNGNNRDISSFGEIVLPTER